jgi:APA family basic amino acid/polyamine antiporter
MARDGAFPRWAARLHPRSQAPTGAIYMQSLWTSLLMLTGTFEQLIVYSGFVLVLFSALAALAVIVLRSKQPALERPFRVPLYPLPPLLFAGFSAWILYFTAVGRPRESLAGIAVVLAGIPLYYYWKSRAQPNC